MARPNAIIHGTDMGVYTGTGTPVLIALATTCQLTFNRDVRDTSNKDSAGYKTVLPGMKNWSVSSEGLYNPGSTNGLKALYDAWTAGTLLTLTFKSATTSTQDFNWSGTAYITSLTMNAPNERNITWSVNFQGTGAITCTDPLAS